jgi:hypothetical protein
MNKGWSNNARTEGDLQEILQYVLSTVSLAEIRRAMKNVFAKCDACLRAEGNNFQKHLLQISYVRVEYIPPYIELKREDIQARHTRTQAIYSRLPVGTPNRLIVVINENNLKIDHDE